MSKHASEESTNKNPLLQEAALPLFSKIKPEHVVPAIQTIIDENRKALAEQLAQLKQPSWDTLVVPFESREDRLSKAWSPVGHLNSVMNSEELRNAYTEALQLLTEYSTEVSQNKDLFRAYEAFSKSEECQLLSTAQKKTISNSVRDFKLAGVDLDEKNKKRYAEIKQRLSELSTQFSNHVLDATQGWYKHITDKEVLSGLPETATESAKQAAESKQLEGYVITLDIPSYLAVMTYADKRALREELYQAYSTRASSLGKSIDKNIDPKQWDNSPLITEILSLKHELSNLLGFNHYAERSLATKMASTPDEVLSFLTELAETALPAAKIEMEELKTFAKNEYGIDNVSAWDIAYYSEKRREAVFALSEEELRPYFPAEKVIEGLFQVAGKLFDVSFEKKPEVETWHKDASYYSIKRKGKEIAGFYFDIYARENKRGGAWMDECRVRRIADKSAVNVNGIQLPVAYLTCNFTAPTDSTPSLLKHMEVTTLFHEFGHGLHHMLTEIDCPAVSGINGVAWDAVELPSQFLENWCWQEEVIPMISSHYETGEPLPKALLDKMLKAKNYQSAMQTVRQVEFALFDFRLHLEYDPNNPQDPQKLLDSVRRQVAVSLPPEYNKFQNSFSHIFAGGYAAGYYSYKWAEVLSSDAFSLFEEQGIFDDDASLRFQKNILEKGGSEDAMDLFVSFRGREPSIEPLLRHSGISKQIASHV
ncbi:MAG: M3 family metallopeptidase [Cellvibrionaceae bacterium]